MSINAIKKICLAFQGPQARFYTLIIDNQDVLKEFEDYIKNRADGKKVSGLYKIMEYISLGRRCDCTMLRKINSSLIENLYEIKKDSLRLYCIKIESNFYIVHGSTKANQKNDINLSIRIAQEFMQCINSKHLLI